METISPGASSTETTNWSGTIVMLGNVLEVKHTLAHTERKIQTSTTFISSFFLFSIPPSSSHPTNHPWNRSTFSQAGRHCCPVLPVWEAAARPLGQDLRREEVSPRGSSLAGFPADQVQGLLRALQPHLRRHPPRVLLGAHCCTLHVSVFSIDHLTHLCVDTLTWTLFPEKAEWKCRWCWEEWT